jgi:hypothetical protein
LKIRDKGHSYIQLEGDLSISAINSKSATGLFSSQPSLAKAQRALDAFIAKLQAIQEASQNFYT